MRCIRLDVDAGVWRDGGGAGEAGKNNIESGASEDGDGGDGERCIR